MSVGINRATGKPLSGWPHVMQSISVIFATRFGSRVMRRNFGSAVPNALGKNLVLSTLLKFMTAFAIAIELWEPRFRVRQFVYPANENDADNMKRGKIGLRMIGDYRPNALSGDFTVEAARTVAL
jgi:phage baseplate assembly protein W